MPMPSNSRGARVLQASFPRGSARVAQASGPAHAARVPAQALTLAPRGAGHPLPLPVRQQMERALGADFSDVRVHVGTEASRIGALAFTTGSDIYFAHGQYNVATPSGQQLLGHELVHVVQQRAGRVRNPFGSDLAVVQDPALEAEADRIAQRALQPATALPQHGARVQTVQRRTIQRHPDDPTSLAIWKLADTYDAKDGDALNEQCEEATAQLAYTAKNTDHLAVTWVAVSIFDTPKDFGVSNHYALEVPLGTGNFVIDATYRQFSTSTLTFKPAKTYVGQYDAWKRMMGELFPNKGVKAMRGKAPDVKRWTNNIWMNKQTFAEAPGEVVNKPPGF